ncbi:hypothetical protein PV327_006929 [Microctonus hyperodae]|uniref:Uncharacterized protein n=1 Tax=Microctonus hyperodae TaxID=165561 RepID=A0AA39KIY7_MICHY|nr:hypothetical protein PV327_006929 [Microctonus hyperodae]
MTSSTVPDVSVQTPGATTTAVTANDAGQKEQSNAKRREISRATACEYERKQWTRGLYGLKRVEYTLDARKYIRGKGERERTK